MNICPAIEIDDAILIDSNLAEDDLTDPYDAAVTYPKGARVHLASTHRVYESAVAGNINNSPENSGSAVWVDVMATNKWRPFDHKMRTAATATGSMSWTLQLSQMSNMVGVFGSASQIRVKVTRGGVIMSDETRDMIDLSNRTDWAKWALAPVLNKRHGLFYFPPHPSNTVEITLTNPSGEVSCKQIGVGYDIELGVTQNEPSLSFDNYSTVETDIFGDDRIVERGTAKRIDFVFEFPSDRADYVFSEFERYAVRPAIYHAGRGVDERYGLAAFGILDQAPSAPISADGVSFSQATIRSFA